MRGLFRFLLPLGLGALLLAGCCANNVCDCRDELADAFYFRFDTSGRPGSFVPRTELDTVLLKRFALPLDAKGQPFLRKGSTVQTFTGYADSLDKAGGFDLATIVRATAVRRDTIALNNNLPFAQSGSRKLNTYLYRIEVRDASRGPRQSVKNNPLRYELKNIALKGEFYGTGCCTCYRNTSKTATFVQLPAPGQLFPRDTVITATESLHSNTPVYTTITKK